MDPDHVAKIRDRIELVDRRGGMTSGEAHQFVADCRYLLRYYDDVQFDRRMEEGRRWLRGR